MEDFWKEVRTFTVGALVLALVLWLIMIENPANSGGQRENTPSTNGDYGARTNPT